MYVSMFDKVLAMKVIQRYVMKGRLQRETRSLKETAYFRDS